MKSWLGLLIVLGVAIPSLRADLGMPAIRTDVVRVPTVGEALLFLGQSDLVTPPEFQRWSGVAPNDGPVATRWQLADGVLVTNNMQLADGKLAIACWGVERK
jgi:hypothetical protein